MENIKNDINAFKYEIVQNIVETNETYYPQDIIMEMENMFQDEINPFYEAFFSEVINFESEEMGYYLSIMTNFFEISKEIKKVIKNISEIKVIIEAFGLTTFQNTEFDIFYQKIKETHTPFIQRILENVNIRYVDEITTLLYFIMKCEPNFPNLKDHIDKYLTDPISVELKYQFSLFSQKNINQHLSIYYDLVQKYKNTKDTSILVDITVSFLDECLIWNMSKSYDLTASNLKKYVWSLGFLYRQLKDDKFSKTHIICEKVMDILEILCSKYEDVFTNSFLLRYVLHLSIDVMKSEEHCDVLYESLHGILLRLLKAENGYEYLSTIITENDINLLEDFEFISIDRVKKLYKQFEKTEPPFTDILTNTFIITPCIIVNGEECLIMEKYIIQQTILESHQNPFTRAELTNEMLNEWMIIHKDVLDKFIDEKNKL